MLRWKRLAGREDSHVKDWAEFDVCLGPSRTSADGVRFSQVSTLFKLNKLCMWKVLDKELRPLPGQMFGFRPWRQCSDIVSFLVEGCKKPKSGAKKMFVIFMDVASAFDAVRAEILGDALLERAASEFSADAVVRENQNLSCRPCLRHTRCTAID